MTDDDTKKIKEIPSLHSLLQDQQVEVNTIYRSMNYICQLTEECRTGPILDQLLKI